MLLFGSQEYCYNSSVASRSFPIRERSGEAHPYMKAGSAAYRNQLVRCGPLVYVVSAVPFHLSNRKLRACIFSFPGPIE